MGEAKRRTESEPTVSVLIPSRGRPAMLARCVASLVDNKGDAKIEIIIGLDDDDPQAEAYAAAMEKAGGAVTIVTAPRPKSMGGIVTDLAAKASGRWLMAFVDDCVISTPDWPARIEEAGAELPRRVGVLYLRDEFHSGFASFPVISRDVVKALGYFHVPYFAFWFNDTWWDEIGTMLGLKRELPIVLEMPEGRGKTRGLREVAFWAQFFNELRPQRLRDAFTLLKLAYDETDPEVGKFGAYLGTRQRTCAEKIGPLLNPRVAEHFEREQAGGEPSEHYDTLKAEAQSMMDQIRANTPRRLKVALAIPSGRTWEAATGVDFAALAMVSAMQGIDIMPANLQSSMITLGRNGTVDVSLENGVDYIMWIDSDLKFPPDALLRLLSHQKDIVGATYNKRVPPYETLGKLAGTKPDQLRGGVHEALLLPGGMVLVKAEVYKTIGWPWYFETYNWPGADGFAAWKTMMRDSWKDMPGADVLDSVEGTAFADWMRANFKLGEFGENILYFSEDNNFCRKARKHGYTIWADLDLSYQMVHLGTLEVTCHAPPEEEIAAETARQDAEDAAAAPSTAEAAD